MNSILNFATETFISALKSLFSELNIPINYVANEPTSAKEILKISYKENDTFKSINDVYFVDLVFYHRILKCHILIDLKVDKFKHEHLSQLNSYVSYYKNEIKHTSDNDPIGILLCTEKGKKMVEYALAGMEEKLFVSKYLLELPSKEILSQFIEEELKKI